MSTGAQVTTIAVPLLGRVRTVVLPRPAMVVDLGQRELERLELADRRHSWMRASPSVRRADARVRHDGDVTNRQIAYALLAAMRSPRDNSMKASDGRA